MLKGVAKLSDLENQFVATDVKTYKYDADENTYTGVILLEEINQGINHRIRMEVEWADEEISNEVDTTLGTDVTNKLQIPITVHAIQYLGEEITPITEE